MKTILRMIATALCLANLHAASLSLDGDFTWNITEPRCSFDLDGKIVNNGASSGTLKVLLYATKNPFPSAGYVVAEQTLGSLSTGYQFTDFRLNTKSNVPAVSGTYYFTLTIAEYTGTGWRNIYALPTGTKKLVAGNFSGQKKWAIPTKTVLPPYGKLIKGDSLKLALKATPDMNLFPVKFQDKTIVTVTSKTKLSSKLRGKTANSEFTYALKDEKFNKKLVTSGQLVIYSPTKKSATIKTTVSLYFQGTKSGTYKSVEITSAGTETTWGHFTLP